MEFSHALYDRLKIESVNKSQKFYAYKDAEVKPTASETTFKAFISFKKQLKLLTYDQKFIFRNCVIDLNELLVIFYHFVLCLTFINYMCFEILIFFRCTFTVVSTFKLLFCAILNFNFGALFSCHFGALTLILRAFKF